MKTKCLSTYMSIFLLTACTHMPVPSNRYQPPPNNTQVKLTSTDLANKTFIPFLAMWSVEASFYVQTTSNSCPKFDFHNAESGYLFTASLSHLKKSRSVQVPADRTLYTKIKTKVSSGGSFIACISYFRFEPEKSVDYEIDVRLHGKGIIWECDDSLDEKGGHFKLYSYQPDKQELTSQVEKSRFYYDPAHPSRGRILDESICNTENGQIAESQSHNENAALRNSEN